MTNLPLEKLTERQQDILSTFGRFRDGAVIPYMKCKRNDPEIMELAEAGYVKITPIEVHCELYDEFSPNFGSLPLSCGIGETLTKKGNFPMNDRTITRLPDAACKIICQTRGSNTLPQCAVDHDELVLIVGMFTVDEHIIFVEIPFSEFAPGYTHVEDFEPLIFPKLRKWLGKDEHMTFSRLHKWEGKPYCRTDSKGGLELCINRFSVTADQVTQDGKRFQAEAGTSLLFSDFAENFACVSDFERLVIDYIDQLPIRSEILR